MVDSFSALSDTMSGAQHTPPLFSSARGSIWLWPGRVATSRVKTLQARYPLQPSPPKTGRMWLIVVQDDKPNMVQAAPVSIHPSHSWYIEKAEDFVKTGGASVDTFVFIRQDVSVLYGVTR